MILRLRRLPVTILTKDLRWLVALKAEAKPIIKALNLERITTYVTYPIYKDKANMNWLVISGVGQKNAASAARFLKDLSCAKRWSVWVNIGIAGSSIGRYGTLFLIDKITQVSSNQCFYPRSVVKTKLRKGELMTVDKPMFKYLNLPLVDMEAAAFVEVVGKFSCRELVVVMKVVSDGPHNPASNLTSMAVSELISKNIPSIFEYLEKVLSLADLEKERFKMPSEYEDILVKWHFTVAQSYELKKLITRYRVAMPSLDIIDRIKESKSSREVIKFLRNDLEKYEIDWN